MHLQPPHVPPPAPAGTTLVVTRQDVQWGRPVFRAPDLTVLTRPELLPTRHAFPVRRFRGKPRKPPPG